MTAAAFLFMILGSIAWFSAFRASRNLLRELDRRRASNEAWWADVQLKLARVRDGFERGQARVDLGIISAVIAKAEENSMCSIRLLRTEAEALVRLARVCVEAAYESAEHGEVSDVTAEIASVALEPFLPSKEGT